VDLIGPRDAMGIAEELSMQYSLGYTPKSPAVDGAFRRLLLRVASRPELRLRTRSGYCAASPANALLRGR
jgi:hypothetical protein